jgi:hypothetical protein
MHWTQALLAVALVIYLGVFVAIMVVGGSATRQRAKQNSRGSR